MHECIHCAPHACMSMHAGMHIGVVMYMQHPSTYLPAYPSIHPSIDLSIYVSTYLSICLSTYLRVCGCQCRAYRLMHRRMYLFKYVSIHPGGMHACIQVPCVSTHPSNCLPACHSASHVGYCLPRYSCQHPKV